MSPTGLSIWTLGVWSPLDGAVYREVMGALGGGALLRGSHWGGLWGLKALFHFQLALFASWACLKMWALSFLVPLATATPPLPLWTLPLEPYVQINYSISCCGHGVLWQQQKNNQSRAWKTIQIFIIMWENKCPVPGLLSGHTIQQEEGVTYETWNNSRVWIIPVNKTDQT